ncbi:MAG: 1,4-dihydroxy-2-naphthoate polyprenyltransferase [Microscillaceae bacterium]|nr:1,4-dihydroxy-2-naphthoate polyprenyltransferase [Microscillaceae bacterium]
MAQLKDWISAFRLRTLPLALASIGMGSFLAAHFQRFNVWVFVLCALTTIFLQVLSNLANDYGDSIHGADRAEREGPSRAVQSGAISAEAMLRAIIVCSVLSFLSGITLLYLAINSWQSFFVFLVLGLLSIAAAITYTAGKKPYGYIGLGDLSVFIFFGLVGVLGTFYLHTHFIEWTLALPAASCGLLATAVLNVNNIRDIESDVLAGKKSIPVRLGRARAVVYHGFLLGGALLCAVFYVLINYQHPLQWLFLLILPLFIVNMRAVVSKKQAAALDPYLKQMAISTLLFVLTFGLGNLW